MRADSSSIAPTFATICSVGARLGVDDDGAGEAHAVLEDAAGVAEPRHDRLDREAHREHPVREHARQPHGGGDVVAVVDRIEVAGRPGIAHERLAGEVHRALCDDVADGERGHCSPSPTSRTDVAVTTWSPAASVISASLVTIALPPIARMPVTESFAVSSSPATIGRE